MKTAQIPTAGELTRATLLGARGFRSRRSDPLGEPRGAWVGELSGARGGDGEGVFVTRIGAAHLHGKDP